MERFIRIKEGLILNFKTLTWNDGWEFERPSLMLSPIIRCWERQMCHEQMVENVLIDAVVEGFLKDESFEETWGWRGYNLKYLQRKFRESLAGKSFPKVNYIAEQSSAEIIRDEDDELAWEIL